MRYVKVLLLAVFFFLSLVFLFQNQTVLNQKLTLQFNLLAIPKQEAAGRAGRSRGQGRRNAGLLLRGARKVALSRPPVFSCPAAGSPTCRPPLFLPPARHSPRTRHSTMSKAPKALQTPQAAQAGKGSLHP